MNPDAFLQDVLAEPDGLGALARAARAPDAPYRGLGDLRGRHVVLIGMGSSRFAALPAAARLRSLGVHAVAEFASTALPTPPGGDVVAVAISASGASAETLTALEPHRGISRTIAITNVPDSPLAALADVTLELGAGPEPGGVACRSFQATVALLALIGGAHPDVLARAAEAQAQLFAARDQWLDALLDVLDDIHTVYAVAPAERISSALQGALMLREGPRVAAVGCETGDWSHVDVYLTRHAGYCAVLFPGSAYDAGLLTWARERASTIVAVGRDAPGRALHIGFPGAHDPVIASLVETSVLELVAATSWQRRTAAGTMP